MNSSRLDTLNHLARKVDQPRVERFLQELLNLKFANEQARSRFEKRFGDLIPTNILFGINQKMYSIVISENSPFEALHRLRMHLAEAWRAPTVLAREISLVRIIGRYLETPEEPRLVDVPAHLYNEDYWAQEEESRIDSCALALVRTLSLADLMRYCPNPSCPAPYFIAKKGRQKYCSEECAAPAQREFKKSWWAEHGKEWRQKRKPKQARKSKQSGKKGGK
jgi:hypothetical protein